MRVFLWSLPETSFHSRKLLFPASNRPPSPSETGVLPALELSANEQKVYDALSDEELSIGVIDDISRHGVANSNVRTEYNARGCIVIVLPAMWQSYMFIVPIPPPLFSIVLPATSMPPNLIQEDAFFDVVFYNITRYCATGGKF
jgi:hypothetical protein